MNSAKTLVLLLIFTAFFDASASKDRPLQAQRLSLRQDVARRVFAEHPEMSRQDRRESILKGVIEMGMTPFEAKLAGGEFSYKVISDSAIWVPNADPIKVMWTQSIRPDGSTIWMKFWNTSQFETAMARTFTVYFVDGKAQNITQRKERGGENFKVQRQEVILVSPLKRSSKRKHARDVRTSSPSLQYMHFNQVNRNERRQT